MRSHPAEYEMVSPGSLEGVLRLMHDEPGKWLPVAGATEVMVMFSAGKLSARRFVNLWNLPELREIHEDAESLTLGGGCTFSQIRNCAAVSRYFPLLAQAASWTGQYCESKSRDPGGKSGECFTGGRFASGAAGV